MHAPREGLNKVMRKFGGRHTHTYTFLVPNNNARWEKSAILYIGVANNSSTSGGGGGHMHAWPPLSDWPAAPIIRSVRASPPASVRPPPPRTASTTAGGSTSTVRKGEACPLRCPSSIMARQMHARTHVAVAPSVQRF